MDYAVVQGSELLRRQIESAIARFCRPFSTVPRWDPTSEQPVSPGHTVYDSTRARIVTMKLCAW